MGPNISISVDQELTTLRSQDDNEDVKRGAAVIHSAGLKEEGGKNKKI